MYSGLYVKYPLFLKIVIKREVSEEILEKKNFKYKISGSPSSGRHFV
jgi:hypothetical protein